MRSEKKRRERHGMGNASTRQASAPAREGSGELLTATVQEAGDASRKFELLLEAVPDAIVGVDAARLIVLLNQQTEKLFGYDRKALLGQPVEILLPRALRDVHVRHREAFAARPRIRPMGAGQDMEGRRKDGGKFPVKINLSPLETADGLLLTIFIRDVTERKEAEAALRRSEENFRTLFERAPYGIYRSSLEGRFLMVNPALVKMLGYDSAEELMQVDMARDVYQDPEERERIIREHGSQDTIKPIELAWKRKDGAPITVRVSGTMVRAETTGETVFEVVAQDVTQERLLEREFRQSQKMEAVGRLAGGIVHDFNNLLTLVQGYGELLETTLEKQHSGRAALAEIRSAAQRATLLTRQLLAFSRKQTIQPKKHNLNEIVSQMERMLRRVITKDVKLVTGLDPTLGP